MLAQALPRSDCITHGCPRKAPGKRYKTCGTCGVHTCGECGKKTAAQGRKLCEPCRNKAKDNEPPKQKKQKKQKE